jgi:hypothetical protein
MEIDTNALYWSEEIFPTTLFVNDSDTPICLDETQSMEVEIPSVTRDTST